MADQKREMIDLASIGRLIQRDGQYLRLASFLVDTPLSYEKHEAGLFVISETERRRHIDPRGLEFLGSEILVSTLCVETKLENKYLETKYVSTLKDMAGYRDGLLKRIKDGLWVQAQPPEILGYNTNNSFYNFKKAAGCMTVGGVVTLYRPTRKFSDMFISD